MAPTERDRSSGRNLKKRQATVKGHDDAASPSASTSKSRRPAKKQKTAAAAAAVVDKPSITAAIASDTTVGPAAAVKPAGARRGRPPKKNKEAEHTEWEVEAVIGVRYASDSTEAGPRFQYAVKWAGSAGGETSWWTPESLQNDRLVLLGLSKSIANGTVWFEQVPQPEGEDEGALIEPEPEPEPGMVSAAGDDNVPASSAGASAGKLRHQTRTQDSPALDIGTSHAGRDGGADILEE